MYVDIFAISIFRFRYTDPSLEGIERCKIFAFKLYCDLETDFLGHSRSSEVAMFGIAYTTLYLSSLVNMPVIITFSEI